jgi:D-3-phosphoglycerate dehydrogenase
MTAILINEPKDFPTKAIERLQKYGRVYFTGDEISTSEIEVLFVRLSQKIGTEILGTFPNLKLIVSPTTGLNHIDQNDLVKMGVTIASLKGRTDFLNDIRATAEHTIALALSLMRKIPAAVTSTRSQLWNRYPFKGGELYGSRVLILGYGRIGQQVAKLYEAFGCTVSAFDINMEQVPPKYMCDWPNKLRETDILSIHVDLNEKSEGMLNRETLDLLPPSSVIVNTSRGEVIDQNYLFRLLLEKRIFAAALDVLVNEPAPYCSETINLIRKIDSDRLLITPHIGGFTSESLSKVELFATELAIEFIENNLVKNRPTPESAEMNRC